MDRHEQFERALSVVQARRAAAVAENQRRTAEISLQIPQIAEISRQLADTAKDIFRVIQSGERVEEQLAQIQIIRRIAVFHQQITQKRLPFFVM